MGVYSYFRISKPSAGKVDGTKIHSVYKSLRNKTFWGATIAYSLYYVCRMTLSVVKQPVIDSGLLTASQLGIIGSALLFVYAVGKFVNGFIADYCNIRKFMSVGLLLSALINLILGVLGLLHGWPGFSSAVLFVVFAVMWGMNGWAQSMGAPPGVISLSRWFPINLRGTYYSIFSATPYFGKFLSFIIIGIVVEKIGWQFGYMFAAVAGLAGAAVVVLFVSDTPESKGLPSVQELSGETPRKTDSMPTRQLQKSVIKSPGIWIIAISSAFVYITQYGVSNWGVFFLQKDKGFSLAGATQIIAFSEAFGVLGTVLAGWLSDKLFRGDRIKPVVISGAVCLAALSLFLFSHGGYVINILYMSMFSLSIGVIYCIVAGLMALDIVPRKATGAALAIVGIVSYAAAGIQEVVSGYLIQGNSAGAEIINATYNFTPVSLFWLAACLVSFLLPVINWKWMKMKIE
ncbi:MAG: MFS transporter [Bacteroidales bacterium]|jgi:OPA family sugar phosphate sensor protein UhpC-like MFS transporter|nr:MFS transporter [Bacteroidales bacterium]MCI1784639.1 MFS transporter [Bacteroidales bacterium]